MALSSTSTFTEISAQYVDNADYDTGGSAAKCRLFIQAVRILLFKVPKRTSHGGNNADAVEIDPLMLQKELDRALAWLSANDSTMADAAGGGGVIHPDFSDFRRELS